MQALLLTLGLPGILAALSNTVLASATGMVARGDFTREFPELGYKLDLITLDGVCTCGQRGAIFRVTMQLGETVTAFNVTLPAEDVRRAQRRTVDRTVYVN